MPVSCQYGRGRSPAPILARLSPRPMKFVAERSVRSHERRMIMQETGHLRGLSEQTLYRALAQRARLKALRRSGRGTPRIVPIGGKP
jgi:hypothetical protein